VRAQTQFPDLWRNKIKYAFSDLNSGIQKKTKKIRNEKIVAQKVFTLVMLGEDGKKLSLIIPVQ
jgi:hypothetical protein